MTLAVTIIMGLGALLIISGLEDSPLADTIKSVVSGQPVGISESANAAKASTPSQGPQGGRK